MSSDLRRLYTELGDVDPATLPAPETLRGQADRRARALVAAACAAIAILVGGTAFAINGALVHTLPPPAPGTTVTSVEPSPPAPSPTGEPLSIPDSAFFDQPASRTNNREQSKAEDTAKRLVIAQFCDASAGSDSSISLARRRSYSIYATNASANAQQNEALHLSILVYRNGGATLAMAQARAALAACPHKGDPEGGDLDYTTLTTTTRGDDTLLIREYRAAGPWAPTTWYYMFIRIGEIIVQLQFMSSDMGMTVGRATVEEYADLAAAAIRAWKG